MTVTIKYDAERGFVETKATGVVTAEELYRETAQTIAIGQASDCYFCLSDFSKAEVDFDQFDLYDLPDLKEEEGLDRSATIGVIPPTSENGKKLAEFYETVCFNRCWSARVFSDREAAVEWLLK